MKMNVQKVSSPLPARRTKNCNSPFNNSPSDKLFLKSDCFGLGSFISSNELQPEVGDLIQVDRVLYTHWALYVGDGNVVHVAHLDRDNNEITPLDTAVIRLSSLSDVAGPNGGVRVNNKIVGAKDRGLEPLPVETVLENCYADLDKEVTFNMLTKNSEHYVTEWKYGSGWSDQAAITMTVMRTLSSDCLIGHNVLVSSLNAVLNSPGSPAAGRNTPNFSSSPVNDDSSGDEKNLKTDTRRA
ncbi:phospholipase A and acyltransferase 1-like [Parasteatoda tepidariorum]|uniref:phospholipase A and acyltransferase 1-like n=1 Tax=Parasteatoda tepidariorum TaxID=114398 RepID=UPI00077FB8D2|nr:phospholipase A and acyltransferase 1-like [Parasteatoda tepidariorum]